MHFKLGCAGRKLPKAADFVITNTFSEREETERGQRRLPSFCRLRAVLLGASPIRPLTRNPTTSSEDISSTCGDGVRYCPESTDQARGSSLHPKSKNNFESTWDECLASQSRSMWFQLVVWTEFSRVRHHICRRYSASRTAWPWRPKVRLWRSLGRTRVSTSESFTRGLARFDLQFFRCPIFNDSPTAA